MIIRDIDFEFKSLKCQAIISFRAIEKSIQLTFRNPDPDIDQGFAYFLPFEYNENFTDDEIVKSLVDRDDFTEVYLKVAAAFNIM
jgi:hypothetical protein